MYWIFIRNKSKGRKQRNVVLFHLKQALSRALLPRNTGKREAQQYRSRQLSGQDSHQVSIWVSPTCHSDKPRATLGGFPIREGMDGPTRSLVIVFAAGGDAIVSLFRPTSTSEEEPAQR